MGCGIKYFLLTSMNMECFGKLIMAILACLLQWISDFGTHPPIQKVRDYDQEIPKSLTADQTMAPGLKSACNTLIYFKFRKKLRAT